MRIFITSFLLFASLTSFANTERFELAGHYHDAKSGMSVTIDDNRHLAISTASWEYPNPLMSNGNGYQTTGYYPYAGCQVPMRTVLNYDKSTQTLFIEFHRPEAVINGLFKCHFPGDIVSYAQAQVSTEISQDWQRFMEGRGCGKSGSYNDLQKQIKNYGAQCASSNGKSSAKLDKKPYCWAADPNDFQCPQGKCWWRGKFFCDIN